MNSQDVYDELRHSPEHTRHRLFPLCKATLRRRRRSNEARGPKVEQETAALGTHEINFPRTELAKRFEHHGNKGAVWNYRRVLGALAVAAGEFKIWIGTMNVPY